MRACFVSRRASEDKSTLQVVSVNQLPYGAPYTILRTMAPSTSKAIKMYWE